MSVAVGGPMTYQSVTDIAYYSLFHFQSTLQEWRHTQVTVTHTRVLYITQLDS